MGEAIDSMHQAHSGGTASGGRFVAPDEGAVDLRDGMWPVALDWAVMAVLFLAGTVAVILVLRTPVFAVLGGMLAAMGWASFRALRMTAGVPRLEAQLATGELKARVMDRGTTGFVPVWSSRTEVLTVRDGNVGFGGSTWPAAHIQITREPSMLLGRGIQISTPAGSRYITFVPALDPALYWSAIVDRRVVPLLRQALAAGAALHPAPTSSAQPAGWYPDPSTPNRLRYWDGTTWTQHQQ